MKGFALPLALLLLLFNHSTTAQDVKIFSNESSAVQATVRDYIEAYYTGNPQRMERTLHPHYLKHMIHGNISMREMTGLEIVREVGKNGVPDLPQTERIEQITVLDISGDIASAKLVTPHWVDYMTLSKFDGGWRILSVVQRIDD